MKISKYIDHTLLKADAQEKDIVKLCAEARQFDFASCCINPGFVKLAKKELHGSGVKVCTVVGFPLGATDTASKAAETKNAIANGADEIDMVINIGALKAGKYQEVVDDIKAVVKAAKGRIVKVIIETCLLTDFEKEEACKAIIEARAHFVKTSTGFSTGGATIADICLFKKVVGTMIEIKASGGVKNSQMLHELIAAGATRIGTSSGVALVQGFTTDSTY